MLARENALTSTEEPPVTIGNSIFARTNEWLRKQWFFFSTIVGVSAGLIFGLVLQQYHLSVAQKLWISMPGVLYMRVLQLALVPVLTTSIFNVVATMNLNKAKRLVLAAATSILFVNTMSSILGLVSVLPIKLKADDLRAYNSTVYEKYGYQILYIFHDLLLLLRIRSLIYIASINAKLLLDEFNGFFRRNAFPADLTKVSIAHVGTDFEHPEKNVVNETVYRKIDVDGVNMLGILFCSFAFGLAANAVNDDAEALKQFSLALYEIVLILMKNFILATPVGACFMVMSAVADVRDMANTFARLGLFFAAHLAAQLVHFLLINSFLVLICRNPFHLLKHCLSSWLISVATGSRMVGLPHFYRACDEYGLSESVSRLVLPLCVILKADGSAIFVASASLYIAQLENAQLSATKICILVVLTTVYATALPSVPFASMFATMNALHAIGVPAEQAALLFSLEWLNDRIRCGETALSSIFCTAFVSYVSEKGCRSGFWKELDDSEPKTDHHE